MKRADLHVHTTASDGLCSPSDVVRLAKHACLCAVGITDHDTMAGIEEAEAAAQALGMEIVPGVEISTEHEGTEIHILGYYLDANAGHIVQLLDDMRSNRRHRVRQMFDTLGDLGMVVDRALVTAALDQNAPGRPHVARALVKMGYVRTVGEAFLHCLDAGRPAYVPRYKLAPCEAVKAVVNAGGVAVFAHPGRTEGSYSVADLVECGLGGIEVYHPDHNFFVQTQLLDIAKRLDLIVTGGSDFHGDAEARSGSVGARSVPYCTVERLKQAVLK